MSTGAVFKAQRSILRKNDSARIKTCAPPYNYMRTVPKQPKMTLPYNKVVTAIAYTNYILTRLLYKPNNLVWHLI